MDIDVGTVLEVIFGVALSACVLTAALFVTLALTQEGDLKFELDRREAPKTRRICAYLYFVSLLVGIAVVIGGGVWRVLAWVPATWDEARLAFAWLAAMSAWPIMFALAGLPGMRRTLAVNSAVTEWMRRELGFVAPSSKADIEKLAKELDRPWASLQERSIAEEKLRFATALLSRDLELETYFFQKREREEARAAAELERIQIEEQRRAALQEEIERRTASVEPALARLVHTLRTVTDVSQLQGLEEALLQHEIVIAAWHSIEELVLSVLPKTVDDVPLTQSQLAANLPRLQGVRIPQQMRVECRFETATFYRVLAVLGSEELPLAMGLRYAPSVSGLLNGFFLTAALQRSWSWPRKPEPMLTMNGLARLLIDNPLPIVSAQFQRWPPPGIRVRRTDADTYEVACLSARPPSGIAELSLTVDCGVSSKLRCRDVFNFPRNVR